MIESIERIPIASMEDSQKENVIRRAIGGNKRAYSSLILSMEDKLYQISRSVLRDDADCADAIQEALLRAWLKLPSLQDPRLFEHWLIRILLRECYRIAKKRKWSSLDAERMACAHHDPTERMMIEDAIYSLAWQQRIPLVMHHMMGYKVYEIAQMLGIPSGTVKSRLMRGRKRLRSMILEES